MGCRGPGYFSHVRMTALVAAAVLVVFALIFAFRGSAFHEDPPPSTPTGMVGEPG
jgi:hypothetical protein